MVALLRALLAWQERTLSRYALAELARSVERERMGVTCGYSDQYLCTFGGLCHLDLRGKRFDGGGGPFATVEDLSAEVHELPFVVAYTGVQHSSDAVHRPIRERWLAGEPAVVAAYERVAELGALGKSALQRGDLAGARPSDEREPRHPARARRLGAANEALIEAALAAGALGAKLAGAGGGGTIVALAPGPRRRALEAALRGCGRRRAYRPVLAPGVRLEPADATLPPAGGPL